ncbi:unnamed protein product [Arctogadus glacialis]
MQTGPSHPRVMLSSSADLVQVHHALRAPLHTHKRTSYQIFTRIDNKRTNRMARIRHPLILSQNTDYPLDVDMIRHWSRLNRV